MNTGKIKDNPEFISHLILQSILFNADRLGASKVNPIIMALDSPSWRHKYYDEHKPDTLDYRNEKYKGHRVKDETIPWDEIFGIYNAVMEGITKYTDFHVMKVPNAEADDIIAVLSDVYKSRGEQVYIVSSDKDFLQLQDEGKVDIYDPLKNQWKPIVDVPKWKKIHTIVGDKSDNILAIKPRTKEATAEKMLKDLDALLQTNHEMKAKWDFNQVMIDFDFIPAEIKNSIIEHMDKQDHSYNSFELLKILGKYRLNKIAENVGKFKLKDGPVETKLNTVHAAKNAIKKIQNQSLEDFFG
jgi:5'-3' exonuclease